MNKGYYVQRILAGKVILNVAHGTSDYIFFAAPQADAKYIGEELAAQMYDEALLCGAFSQADILNMLEDKKIWTDNDERELKTFQNNLEELKCKSLQLVFQEDRMAVSKKAMRITEQEIEKRLRRKHSLDSFSAEYIAELSKNKYIFAASLYYKDSTPIFACDDYDTTFITEAMTDYVGKKIPTPTLRDIARTDPWRSIWALKGADSIFGVPIRDYTDEQQLLLAWTTLYDNVLECAERPSQMILGDDDLFDGWLIEQRRKRDAEEAGRKIDSMLSDKAKQGQEVFIVAQGADKIKEIESQNRGQSKAIKDARMQKLMREGKVNELEMPDQKRKLRMAVNQKFSEMMRKK